MGEEEEPKGRKKEEKHTLQTSSLLFTFQSIFGDFLEVVVRVRLENMTLLFDGGYQLQLLMLYTYF